MSEKKSEPEGLLKFFDFYEIAAVLAPGVVALAGVSLGNPDWRAQLLSKDLSIGALALIAVLGYAMGHVVQMLGNTLEKSLWFCAGGHPTDWIRTARRSLVTSDQREKIVGWLAVELGVPADSILATSSREWRSLVGQMAARVRAG